MDAHAHAVMHQVMGGDQVQSSNLPADSANESVHSKDKGEESSLATTTTGPGKSKGKGARETSESQKEDYIHVRARRGQATNSHSLAERVRIWSTGGIPVFTVCCGSRSGIHTPMFNPACCVFFSLQLRREKISERMKLLQDLVPGCSKVGLSSTEERKGEQNLLVCFYVGFHYKWTSLSIGIQVTGKAVMLDEIINYVQSLQRQVEVISNLYVKIRTTLSQSRLSYEPSLHLEERK
jgi:hypothetical protein